MKIMALSSEMRWFTSVTRSPGPVKLYTLSSHCAFRCRHRHLRGEDTAHLLQDLPMRSRGSMGPMGNVANFWGVLEMGCPKINQVTDHFGKTCHGCLGHWGLCQFHATVWMRLRSQFAKVFVPFLAQWD